MQDSRAHSKSSHSESQIAEIRSGSGARLRQGSLTLGRTHTSRALRCAHRGCPATLTFGESVSHRDPPENGKGLGPHRSPWQAARAPEIQSHLLQLSGGSPTHAGVAQLALQIGRIPSTGPQVARDPWRKRPVRPARAIGSGLPCNRNLLLLPA